MFARKIWNEGKLKKVLAFAAVVLASSIAWRGRKLLLSRIITTGDGGKRVWRRRGGPLLTFLTASANQFLHLRSGAGRKSLQVQFAAMFVAMALAKFTKRKFTQYKKRSKTENDENKNEEIENTNEAESEEVRDVNASSIRTGDDEDVNDSGNAAVNESMEAIIYE
jgi:hypothetical protein